MPEQSPLIPTDMSEYVIFVDLHREVVWPTSVAGNVNALDLVLSWFAILFS